MTIRWAGLSTCLVRLVLPAALLLPTEARSEDGPTAVDPILVGTRVRLQSADLQGRLQGTVVETDDRSLVVRTDDRLPIRVSRDAITRLEVSTGRRSRAIKGMAIGATIGAGAFAWIPREEYCADYDLFESCPSRAEMIGTGVVGGALWGLLIGHFVKTDRWSSVPLDGAGVRLQPVFRERGVAGLAVSVTW